MASLKNHIQSGETSTCSCWSNSAGTWLSSSICIWWDCCNCTNCSSVAWMICNSLLPSRSRPCTAETFGKSIGYSQVGVAQAVAQVDHASRPVFDSRCQLLICQLAVTASWPAPTQASIYLAIRSIYAWQ